MMNPVIHFLMGSTFVLKKNTGENLCTFSKATYYSRLYEAERNLL